MNDDSEDEKTRIEHPMVPQATTPPANDRRTMLGYAAVMPPAEPTRPGTESGDEVTTERAPASSATAEPVFDDRTVPTMPGAASPTDATALRPAVEEPVATTVMSTPPEGAQTPEAASGGKGWLVIVLLILVGGGGLGGFAAYKIRAKRRAATTGVAPGTVELKATQPAVKTPPGPREEAPIDKKAEPVAAKEDPKPVAKEEPKPVAKEEPKPVAAKEDPKPVAKEEPKPVAAKDDAKPKPVAKVKSAPKSDAKPAADKPAAKKPTKGKSAEPKPNGVIGLPSPLGR